MLPLVCIDVDGTLVGPAGEPTDAVWWAVERALGRGQHLALSTARGAFGPTLDWARRLDPAGWHVFHAGAALVHTGDGAVRAHGLADPVVTLAETIARDRGWVLERYSAADYVVATDHPLAVDHARLLGVPHRVRRADDLDGDVVRVQFVVPLDDADEVVRAMGDPTVGERAAVGVATSPAMPGAAFVSVTAPGVTKASAIGELADLLGTTLDRVMMVGDGDNDLEAVAVVGHGVAMGNATSALEAVADHRVPPVTDDGLVDALELSARL